MRLDEIKEKYGNVEIPDEVLHEVLFTMKDCQRAFKDMAKTILKDFTEISLYDEGIVKIAKYGEEIIVEDEWNDYSRTFVATAWKPFLNELYYYVVQEVEKVSDLFFDKEYMETVPSSIERLKMMEEIFKGEGLLDKTYKLALDIRE